MQQQAGKAASIKGKEKDPMTLTASKIAAQPSQKDAARMPKSPDLKRSEEAEKKPAAKDGKPSPSRHESKVESKPDKQKATDQAVEKERRSSKETSRKDDKGSSKPPLKPVSRSDDKAAGKSKDAKPPATGSKAAVAKPEDSIIPPRGDKHARESSKGAEKGQSDRSKHKSSSSRKDSDGKARKSRATEAVVQPKVSSKESKTGTRTERVSSKESPKEKGSKSKDQSERINPAKSVKEEKASPEILPQPPPALPPLPNEPPPHDRQGRFDSNSDHPPLPPLDAANSGMSEEYMLANNLFPEPGPRGGGDDSPSFAEQFYERHALETFFSEQQRLGREPLDGRRLQQPFHSQTGGTADASGSRRVFSNTPPLPQPPSRAADGRAAPYDSGARMPPTEAPQLDYR